MKVRLLINRISFIVAMIFLALALFTKNIYLVLVGVGMIAYSENRIKKVKK